MRDAIIDAMAALERRFKERSDEIACSLLALCAGEHILFLGPPGTAKSLLARSVCEAVDGSFFYYLLTRFTTPEEVFGPLSLKALQEDDFSRKVDGYLPTADIAFLDEIFKANSSILNSFLTILNERKFHNGQRTADVPLITAFGASNELPAEEENLEALYDRFLFRCVVSPIRDEDNFRDMLFGAGDRHGPARLTVGQIEAVRKAAQDVGIDEGVQRIVLRARKELARRRIEVSDRRWKKIVDALRAAAAAADERTVDRSMVILLKHMAWNRPEQRDAVYSLLIDLIIAGGESLEQLSRDVADLHGLLLRTMDRPFPYPVRCYDCGEVIDSSKTLAGHNKDRPGHRYFDPYRTSLHLRFTGYEDLLSLLKEEYGWDFVRGPAGRKREYCADYRGLRDRYEQAARQVGDGMEELKRQLAGNVWVSDDDAAAILNRYEARRRTLGEVGDALGSIGLMLKQVADDAKAAGYAKAR